MKALEIFESEHQTVLGKLRELRESVNRLREGAGVEAERGTLEDFNRLIEGDIRKHFKNEEEALFPVLGSVPGMRNGPITVMLAEHDILYNAFNEFNSGVEEENREQVINAGDKILTVLTDHIHKEDNVLFPMSRQYLRPDQLEEVDKRMVQ